MAASAGTINDSPWADANNTSFARLPAEPNQPKNSVNRSFYNEQDDNNNNNNNNDNNNNNNDNNDHEDASWLLLRSTVYAVLVGDAIVGLLAVAAGSLLLVPPDTTTDDAPVTVAALLFAAASVLFLRAATAATALRTDACHRCGLQLSVSASALLIIAYSAGAATILARPQTVSQYLQHYHFRRYWTRHHLLQCLAAAALLECIRWQLYRTYRRRLLRRDAYQLLHPETSARLLRNAARRGSRRPWWWQSTQQQQQQDDPNDNNTVLTQQLLHDRDLDPRAISIASPSSWWRFRWSADTVQDPRADGSVDFASVQEEWASRTEEDPFWWSRNERDVALQGGVDWTISYADSPLSPPPMADNKGHG